MMSGVWIDGIEYTPRLSDFEAQTLPSLLEEARHKLRINQKQAADAIGVARSQYCMYELGRRTPRRVILGRMHTELGIPAEDLLLVDEAVPEVEG